MDKNLYILNEYLNEYFNLDTYIDKQKLYIDNTDYYKFLIKSLFTLFVLILLYYKYYYFIYLIYILFIIIIINTISYIGINKINYNNPIYINYNKLNLKTGDILSNNHKWFENSNQFYTINLITKIGHNGIIIKFNNILYLLHLYPIDTYKLGIYTIKFKKNKLLEIVKLDDYINSLKKYNYIYRIIEIKNELNYNDIFNVIKYNFNKDIVFRKYSIFRYLDIEEWYKKQEYYNNCASFILQLLQILNIIPLFNYNNFASDDLIFLITLSNNVYYKIKYYKILYV